jgi:hypothetical protein
MKVLRFIVCMISVAARDARRISRSVIVGLKFVLEQKEDTSPAERSGPSEQRGGSENIYVSFRRPRYNDDESSLVAFCFIRFIRSFALG